MMVQSEEVGGGRVLNPDQPLPARHDGAVAGMEVAGEESRPAVHPPLARQDVCGPSVILPYWFD